MSQYPVKLYLLILAAVLTAVYLPVFSAGLVNFDDPGHFIDNPLTYDHSLQGLINIFFQTDSVNRTYIPLTILSFNLEHWLFGIRPEISHGINFGLFLGICLAILRLGERLGLAPAGALLAAAIFGLHPMHVEPVAWITSRKDMLYTLFYFISLLFYLRYSVKNRGTDYVLALIFSLLSSLAKPMALSLPLIMLLCRWLMRQNMSPATRADTHHHPARIIITFAPFLLTTCAVAMITYLQNSRNLPLKWPESPLLWGWTAAFYPLKFFWPANLSPLYTAPQPIRLDGAYLLSWLAIAGAVLSLIFFRKNRWWVFALLFYTFSAFYLWRIDEKDLTIVADRFMLAPSAGFCIWAGYSLNKISSRGNLTEKIIPALTAAGLVLLGFLTFQQTRLWTNSWTLWSKQPPASLAASRLRCLIDHDSFAANRKNIADHILAQMPSRPPSKQLERHFNALRLCLGLREFRRINQPLTRLALTPGVARLYRLVKDPRADDILKEACRQSPALIDNLIYSGWVALISTRGVRALQYFEESLVVRPQDAGLWALKAAAQQMIHDASGARSSLETSRKINPRHEVLKSIEKIYFREPANHKETPWP